MKPNMKKKFDFSAEMSEVESIKPLPKMNIWKKKNGYSI